MINVSKEFRETMRTRRDFREYADITLASGTVLNLEAKDFTISNNSITDGAGASALPLGEAVEKSIQIEIMNDNDQFSEYDFFGAKIKLYLKFQLSESVETVNKGTYTVVTPETYGTVISIIAVDDMYKADKAYDSTLSYPATAGEILRDACQKCGIPLLSTTFPNSTKEVAARPEDVTYRQVIGYCAMFAAGNARINVNGYLSIISYDFSPFEELEGLDGGTFDEDTPYSSGDSANGGSFNPWNTGTTYDGGTFGDRDDIHILYSFKNLSLDTDDVVITGVQIELDDDEMYVSGNEGYMFAVENPLFSGIEKEMVNYLGSRLIGLKMRKFSGDHVADPTIEAYDLAYIIDRKQNAYQTIITDVDFSVFGWTTISNSAASTIRNSSKYYSNISKAVVEARKNTEEQITDYDLAVQQLTSIMANSMGMFTTSEKTENGGYIVYQHDKPTLEESDIIWKKSEAGFQVSTDGGKTWNAGMDAQGNSAVNVLSAIGITFDWARGGTLTLGGNNNENGRLRLLDAYGSEVGQLSNSGINFLKGIIKLGSLFEVDNEGNVIANSLKSSNAEITGGKFEVISTSTSVISVSDGDKKNARVNVNGLYVESKEPVVAGNPVTRFVSNSGHMYMYRDGTSKVVIDAATSDNPSFIMRGSTSSNVISMYANICEIGPSTTFGNSVSVRGSFFADGTKSRRIKSPVYGDRLLYCYETPSPIFGDIGQAKTDEEGICIIPFDDIFFEAINSNCEYQVFLQKEGEGDLWVEKKMPQYFIVKGTAEIKFSWEVKAKQKGYEYERLEVYSESENNIVDYEHQGQSIYESYINSQEALE